MGVAWFEIGPSGSGIVLLVWERALPKNNTTHYFFWVGGGGEIQEGSRNNMTNYFLGGEGATKK